MRKPQSKTGLPVGDMVTKCTLESGKTMFLRARYMIVNAVSNHTLLSSYQMRELGMIVYDVANRYLKAPGEYGTQSLQTVDEADYQPRNKSFSYQHLL